MSRMKQLKSPRPAVIAHWMGQLDENIKKFPVGSAKRVELETGRRNLERKFGVDKKGKT